MGNTELGVGHSKPMQLCYSRIIKITILIKNTNTIKSALAFVPNITVILQSYAVQYGSH